MVFQLVSPNPCGRRLNVTLGGSRDDQSPEDLALALDRLRARPDVHDVIQTPVFGKKGRLATSIRLLGDPAGQKVGRLAPRFWSGPSGYAGTTATVQERLDRWGCLSPEYGSIRPTTKRGTATPAAMSREGVDALLVGSGVQNFKNLHLITELSENARLPTIYLYREAVEMGGLMAYAFDFREHGRQAADEADQIFKGAKPGDIPMYQPSVFAMERRVILMAQISSQTTPGRAECADWP
jgi:hypothetical protein